MSDNILTLIERRSKTDLMIFFGLALLTLVLMWVLFNWVKPLISSGNTQTEEIPV